MQDCDAADYAAIDADVAIVATSDRLRQNFPAYQKLLGVGINVICHGAESYFPQGADPEMAHAIDALAKHHGVTFTGTGIWDFSRIWSGILVAGPATRIHSFFHKSVTDAQAANLPLMLVCGVSLTQEAYHETMSSKLGIIGGLYKLIPHHVFMRSAITSRRSPSVASRCCPTNPCIAACWIESLHPASASGPVSSPRWPSSSQLHE